MVRDTSNVYIIKNEMLFSNTLNIFYIDMNDGTRSVKGFVPEETMITRDRHRHHLEQCVESLERFLDPRLPADAAAEEIRLAMLELGKVTGRVDVEELLDVIFRDFCIGK